MTLLVVVHWFAVADNDPTLTVDDDESDADAPSSGFSLDETVLGRSESVFDSGVDFMPAAVPPVAPHPNAQFAGQPAGFESGGADYAVGVSEEPQRALTNRERNRRVRLEARRVRRIVRYVEPWSVLKISLLFYFCLWLIFVLAGVLLWSFAESSGVLTSIEELIESLFALEEENEFWSGGRIFEVFAASTLVLSVAGVTLNVLLCVLYNLISDLTGGIRVTVIEEESARFTPPKRRQRRR